MKRDRNIEVICGNGRGKTSLAIGEALKTAAKGESVIIIQFLKGSEQGDISFLENRQNLDIKLFRFEKQAFGYNELSDHEKQEEKNNIINGVNFARKVIVTRECDLLVLDEILGLIAMDILSREALKELLSQSKGNLRLILTGRELPPWLSEYVDTITTLTTESFGEESIY